MIELFVVCLIFNFLIFLNLDKLSKFVKLNDEPDGKLKKHKTTVPLLGGTIFLINLLIFVLISIIFPKDKLIFITLSNREYFSVFFFILSFYFIGLYDDKFKLKPEKKLIIGIFICIVVLSINKNLLINNFSTSFYDYSIFLNNFKFFFTIFCIIILINALNFYDGINGQSLIFFIIIYSFLAYKSSFTLFYLFILFNLTFLLILNLKNKIFLGDNGIYLIGSLLVVSIIYEHNKFNSIVYADEIFFLLILPGFDLLRLSLTRMVKGKNAFYGDRNHIHHLLINKFSLLSTNFILIFFGFMPIILFSIFNLSFLLILFVYTFSYLILIYKILNR
jgi:UDP-GlcNAc:undecaprenyl-phosphate GlcNAc-1-phosphate transferase